MLDGRKNVLGVCLGSISAILTVFAFIQLLGAEQTESTTSLQEARRGFATQPFGTE